jgi:truncated hemoglobin YjbI
MAGKIRTIAAQRSVHDSNLYQAMGGTAGCRDLSATFYAGVDHDPILRPFFPGKTHKCAIEEFAAFLVQFLGGPSEDAERRWWLSLRESHGRFKLGRKERNAWMKNMVKALDEEQIEEPVRGALLGFFERSSAYVVNQGQPPAVAGYQSAPGGGSLNEELARRWDVQLQLDEAVAAVRTGDADRAISLLESSSLQTCGRSVLGGMIALMIRSGHGDLLGYARKKMTQDRALTTERYAGFTLLHTASGQGQLATVELLLGLGVDPNVSDGGAHAPLYSVGNECGVPGGGDVVRVLVRAGANVNADDGVKRCTALHMAARRGHVEVTEALLDCGANIEARDSLGETPLRRAVNCDKTDVAAFLVSKGADIHSKGSKGLTPVLAARSPAMKRLMQSSGRR